LGVYTPYLISTMVSSAKDAAPPVEAVRRILVGIELERRKDAAQTRKEFVVWQRLVGVVVEQQWPGPRSCQALLHCPHQV
jgi:hypothetical protein